MRCWMSAEATVVRSSAVNRPVISRGVPAGAASASQGTVSECELIDRRPFHTHIHTQAQAQARQQPFRYTKGWYNPHRHHSAFDRLSLMHYGKRYHLSA